MYFDQHLLTLVLNLGSPQSLDSGSQTIRGSIEEQKAEHSKKRDEQCCNLEGLPKDLQVTLTQKRDRAAVITVHMAHTDASVQRIQHTQNVIDRDLGIRNLQNHHTQIAEGARTNETGTRHAAVNWL